MKHKILCLVFCFISCGVIAQDKVTLNYWTSGTACNLPAHRWELSLFTASGYGITDKLEISAHPLTFFLMPQVKLKAGWGTRSGFLFATEHGIFYPTLFMQLVSAKGAGGLISPEFDIPQMIAITNRLLVATRPFRNTLLTVHAGISLAVKAGYLDPRSTIDLPVIYPRLAVFYNQPEFVAGLDFRGQFIPRFGWLFNVENFMLCGTRENYFLENKGVLAYTSRKGIFRMEGGYKLCFGRYPAGPQWHLLPVINLALGIGK